MNLDRFLDAVGHGMGGFKWLVSILLGGLSTRAQWEDVTNFFKEKDTDFYNVYLAQSLDMILSKFLWVERDSGDVEVSLNENGYRNTEAT